MTPSSSQTVVLWCSSCHQNLLTMRGCTKVVTAATNTFYQVLQQRLQIDYSKSSCLWMNASLQASAQGRLVNRLTEIATIQDMSMSYFWLQWPSVVIKPRWVLCSENYCPEFQQYNKPIKLQHFCLFFLWNFTAVDTLCIMLSILLCVTNGLRWQCWSKLKVSREHNPIIGQHFWTTFH